MVVFFGSAFLMVALVEAIIALVVVMGRRVGVTGGTLVVAATMPWGAEVLDVDSLVALRADVVEVAAVVDAAEVVVVEVALTGGVLLAAGPQPASRANVAIVTGR